MMIRRPSKRCRDPRDAREDGEPPQREEGAGRRRDAAAPARGLLDMAAVQLPLNTLPGMRATNAKARPDTSRPRMAPRSIRYATKESHDPPWGSSPIRHGHGAKQEQASRMEPSTS
jgi:hypothetical protein